MTATSTTFQRVNQLAASVEELQKNVKHLSDQAERIDSSLGALVSQASEAINNLGQRIAEIEKTLGQVSVLRDYVRGLARLAGEDAVAQAVANIQKEDFEAQNQKIRTAVDEGLKLGRLKKTEKVLPGSLVVVEETTQTETRTAFLELSRMPTDLQKEFEDREVGYTKEFDGKGSWVLKEVYTVVPATTQEAPASP